MAAQKATRPGRRTAALAVAALVAGHIIVSAAPTSLSAHSSASRALVDAGTAATPPERPAPAGQLDGATPATAIERVRSRRTPSSVTVTLSGNGSLAPSRVSEAGTRQLVLDFPGVIAKAGPEVDIAGGLVTKVRLAVTSRAPLLSRVVMETATPTAYRVERSGQGGRDLDVVFEPLRPASAAPSVSAALPSPDQRPDPPITMEQAMRNVAAITGPDPGLRAPAGVAAIPIGAPSSLVRQNLTSAPLTPQQQLPAVPPEPPSTAAPATPPSPTPEPLQGGGSTGDQARKFTGHPISLDFQGADLRAVLRGFSEISGLNMVIDPDVQGTVDIILNDVPWDQALDVILRANQIDYTVDGTIVRIAKIETLRKEQDLRQALAKSAADAGTLIVRTFGLSYARASAVAPLIKRAALSARGDVQIDDRTNTLIISDLQAKLDTVSSLLLTLDRAEPQVEVEARIVQTTREFARAIGVQWGLNGRVSPAIGNTTGLAFPNSGSVGGRLGTVQDGLVQGSTDPRASATDQTSTGINLGLTDATSAIGLALGSINGAFNLDVALSALESSGKGRILSTPRLTTQNNVEAEVSQGIQIPLQTVANNTVTVTFKDAVLVLRVTPQITAANTVIMKITIENAAADFSRAINGIPPIDTQRANTQVQINDGSTTVIGGIFVSDEQSSTDKTPLLSRVPLLGWLFKRERLSDSSRELLIFITPRILKG